MSDFDYLDYCVGEYEESEIDCKNIVIRGKNEEEDVTNIKERNILITGSSKFPDRINKVVANTNDFKSMSKEEQQNTIIKLSLTPSLLKYIQPTAMECFQTLTSKKELGQFIWQRLYHPNALQMIQIWNPDDLYDLLLSPYQQDEKNSNSLLYELMIFHYLPVKIARHFLTLKSSESVKNEMIKAVIQKFRTVERGSEKEMYVPPLLFEFYAIELKAFDEQYCHFSLWSKFNNTPYWREYFEIILQIVPQKKIWLNVAIPIERTTKYCCGGFKVDIVHLSVLMKCTHRFLTTPHLNVQKIYSEMIEWLVNIGKANVNYTYTQMMKELNKLVAYNPKQSICCQNHDLFDFRITHSVDKILHRIVRVHNLFLKNGLCLISSFKYLQQLYIYSKKPKYFWENRSDLGKLLNRIQKFHFWSLFKLPMNRLRYLQQQQHREAYRATVNDNNIILSKKSKMDETCSTMSISQEIKKKRKNFGDNVENIIFEYLADTTETLEKKSSYNKMSLLICNQHVNIQRPLNNVALHRFLQHKMYDRNLLGLICGYLFLS